MRKLLLVTTVMLTLALGLWFTLGASATTPKKPASGSGASPVTTTSVVSHAHGNASTSSRQASSRSDSSSKTSVSTKASSNPGESGNEGESGGEQEGEGGGNESDNHEDPDGQDVNHECPPNCDTGNGEQP